jgi:hypothetical protein
MTGWSRSVAQSPTVFCVQLDQIAQRAAVQARAKQVTHFLPMMNGEPITQA